MEPYEPDDDTLIDLGPEDKWVDDNVIAAVLNLQEILYEAGCSVNGITITVPATPGDNVTLNLDYGSVKLEAKEIA